MADVILEGDARDQLEVLPERIKARVVTIIARLENWPVVSGAKPLRGRLAGRYRIRTGDYRLQFRVERDQVVIERIGHRDRFYE